MTVRTYAVAGMACRHCADSVSEELEQLPGVTAVAVDVDGESVTVTSDRDLDLVDVRAAVEEAGYEVTGEEG